MTKEAQENRDKLIQRMKDRKEQLDEAKKAAQLIEQLIGAVETCYDILKNDYDMSDEELQELLK